MDLSLHLAFMLRIHLSKHKSIMELILLEKIDLCMLQESKLHSINNSFIKSIWGDRTVWK